VNFYLLFFYFLEFQATPTLYLDFSNKSKEDAAILSCQVDELSHILNEKSKEIKMLQDNIKFLSDDVRIFRNIFNLIFNFRI
jgi:hypothetical protein